MFQTSIDLMYGALTLSILLFTGFLLWMMYYAIQILKQGNEVIHDIRTKIAEFEEALANIREKVVSSASSISFIASEMGTVLDLVRSRTRKKSTTKK